MAYIHSGIESPIVQLNKQTETGAFWNLRPWTNTVIEPNTLHSPRPRSFSHPPCVITSIFPLQYLTTALTAGGLLFQPCMNFLSHCFSKPSFILLSTSHVADNDSSVIYLFAQSEAIFSVSYIF